MPHQIALHWTGGKSMESSVSGFTLPFTIDAMGKNAIDNPKQLMLVSLAACTAFDVIPMLEKMRMPYTDFQIFITASLTDEHPKIYKEVHIKYVFKGEHLDRNKIEKAVHLSEEKYCGVSAMFKYFAKVTFEITCE